VRHLLRNTFALALVGVLALAPQASLFAAAPQRNDDRNNRNQQDNRGGDNGYDRNGRDRAGYDHDGWNRDGYDRDGYDRDGYDFRGFDRRGRQCSGGSGHGHGGHGHNDKVTICHKESRRTFNTIQVNENAVWAHLAHGDYLGPCATSGYR